MTGSPVVIELDRALPGPQAVVWDLITDWERQGDWMLEASDFVVLTPHREGVGVEAEATVRIGGIRTRDRIRVARWEPGRLLGIEHIGWVGGYGELRLVPRPDSGTHLYWTEALRPPLGPLGAAGMRLCAPIMRRIFARDLRILESLVRARSEG